MRAIALFISLLPIAASAWEYAAVTDSSSILERKVHSISVDSEQGTYKSVLSLRCGANNLTQFVFQTYEVLLTDAFGDTSIKLTLDDNHIKDMFFNKWRRDKNKQNATNSMVAVVQRELAAGEVLRIQVNGFAGKTSFANFNVSGLEEAVEPLKPHCSGL